MIASVYIHLPFCKNICSYCDFCKFYYNSNWVLTYLEALNQEIKERYENDVIKTIYIGGGTPSSLSESELKRFFQIIKQFNLAKDYEITFECNIEDINEKLLKILTLNKINRLSIGIQTFNPQLLKVLNRHVTYQEAKEKIKLCRLYNFNNINLDLMYGIKNENLKMLKKDLKLFLSLKPDHLSTYSLIIEEHTLLKLNNVFPIEENLEAQMYHYLKKYLTHRKFVHYELSNFAKKSKESLHNLTYWNNEEYYGFGLGACGYLEKTRYENTRSLSAYLAGKWSKSIDLLVIKDQMDNEVMLGLRKIKGLNVKKFQQKYQTNIFEEYPIIPLLKSKELIFKKGYIFINPRKLYIMNEILIKMI